jgi:hypothetical protein
MEQLATPVISTETRALLTAALFGSILSLLFLGEAVTWRVALSAILSGASCAYFGAPYAAEYFHLSPAYNGLLGFVIGLTAMSALAGIFKMMKLFRDDPGAALARFLPWIKKRDSEL